MRLRILTERNAGKEAGTEEKEEKVAEIKKNVLSLQKIQLTMKFSPYVTDLLKQKSNRDFRLSGDCEYLALDIEFDGMAASVRITVFDKKEYELIKSEVLKYSVKSDSKYCFKWDDHEEPTNSAINMGVSEWREGGFYIDIPLY